MEVAIYMAPCEVGEKSSLSLLTLLPAGVYVFLSFCICGLEGDIALWVYGLRRSLSVEHSSGTSCYLKDPH